MYRDPEITYHYDGSFAGFLTCVQDSRENHFTPAAFFTPEDDRISFFPVRNITTNQQRAKALYREIRDRISPAAQQLTACAFLTCMEERERAIWRFLNLGWRIGPGVTYWLTDPRVAPIQRAVQHLKNEAHLLKGFLRFADYGTFLAGEITPKNRVLPLLRPHFCSRYNTESFLIHDKTYQEVLFYHPHQWRILPVTGLDLPELGQEELAWQDLWKRFYHAIAIQERKNPKLRMSNVPKRYWDNMTELREEL